jgi:hypothetical protein
MHGINLNYPGPDSAPAPDHLDTIEHTLAIHEHSLTFWDADAAELVRGADPDDPWAHPSWDVADALAGEDGWDDPAEAVEVRELLADETRVMALADRSPSPAEEFHTALLALVPVDGSGLWPATGDYGEQEVWAA